MEPTKKQVERHEHKYEALPSPAGSISKTLVCKTCDKPSSVQVRRVPKKGK